MNAFFRWLASLFSKAPATAPTASTGPSLMSPALLRTLGTADPDGWAAALAPACARFEINTSNRMAMFLANIIHETGGFRTLTESLNYSTDALISKFGRHRITEADAYRLGRAPGQDALTEEQQKALANVLYGGEWGADHLGNTQPGDGWNFRGYGLIQATGRYMWEKLRVAFNLGTLPAVRYWLQTKQGAALSAAWIWTVEKKCNPMADAGDVYGARKAVNGGTNGLEDDRHGSGVRTKYARILQILEAR